MDAPASESQKLAKVLAVPRWYVSPPTLIVSGPDCPMMLLVLVVLVPRYPPVAGRRLHRMHPVPVQVVVLEFLEEDVEAGSELCRALDPKVGPSRSPRV